MGCVNMPEIKASNAKIGLDILGSVAKNAVPGL